MKKMNKLSISESHRRELLMGIGSLALIGIMPKTAHAQSNELIVTNWGGDWNDRTVKFIEAPLIESKGINIVRALNLEPERKTKLLAERNLPRGTIGIAHFSNADAYELNEQGILEQLDYANIPNAKAIIPSLRSPYFMPWVYGGVTLAYNPKFIKTPPTSFADLWKSEYAGKIGVLDQSFFNWIYMAALVGGGKMNMVDSAFPKLLQMKTKLQPKIYPTHQHLAAGFANEEVWISANYSARIEQWKKDKVPVASSYPKEGAVTIVFGAVIPKKSPNKTAAYTYLNALLDPKGLGQYCEASMYSPSTSNAIVQESVKAKIEFTPQQITTLNNVDYAYQAKNIASWLQWWNKEFKG